MRIKRTLALLLAFIMAFGIISTAYAGVLCKFCHSSSVDNYWEYPDVNYWIEEKTFPDGKLYYRECRRYYNVYECRSCGEEWRFLVTKYTPWKLHPDA